MESGYDPINSLKDSVSDADAAYTAAVAALTETIAEFPLGSTNIKSANKSPSASKKFRGLKTTLQKPTELNISEGKKEIITNPKEEPENDVTYSPKSLKQHTDKIVLYSPLLFKSPRRLMVDALIDEKVNDIAKKRLDLIRAKVQQIITMTEHMDVQSRRLLVREMLGNFAKQYGVGNCEELATYAFLTLIKSQFPGKVEFVAFKNGDHVFIVLNRPSTSNPNDPKTWGPEAVILDPWIRKVFTADKFVSIWKNNTLGLNPYIAETFVKFDNTSFIVKPKVGISP